jgi:hypothetical protein
MTPQQLRQAIAHCERAGHTGAVVTVNPRARRDRAGAVELAPLVYGHEYSRRGDELLVTVDLPSLRRLLYLTEIGDQPPQGTV